MVFQLAEVVTIYLVARVAALVPSIERPWARLRIQATSETQCICAPVGGLHGRFDACGPQ